MAAVLAEIIRISPPVPGWVVCHSEFSHKKAILTFFDGHNLIQTLL